MKISEKKLNRLIDERLEQHLKRLRKKEQVLKKRLEEACALVEGLSEPPRSSGSRQRERRQRFDEYDD